ncbi:DUF4930 family protein [Staphylococcus simiae]|uniref:DUF4930 family protein n=1 Tax=Staphylococcus simiae TaxID=308354 RepID=UPI001A969FAD|nr:DUF4930 family protein [Staphylococcus simiae]MBO1198457.1 DUF4930 family protein [Staphylococcus simiae]MBO1201727.1 DUF4930 family protein [Staphylococcus simiae]MBO1203928.1 DUF4930 family protein [Staphylococcus simiae]MBO1210448.1 DUF4930 family protein [Staphylococcus simiae]MBO1230160.1 DUF4930 family protein [Staphylococcus simiae]
MKTFFTIIKNIIAVMAILVIVYIALKYAPFLRDQEWNPINQPSPQSTQVMQDNSQNPQPRVLENGKRYSLEDNDLIKNVPTSQIKNVFNFIDKREFMDVSGLTRMAYNEQYLIGQRDNEFIIYKFGSDSIRVYNTEFEMQQDLNELGQNLIMKPKEAYQ